MNQKKNHGFTLIELLAVIVILAIIALIAVPVIMNIINKANKSAFKDTAYGVISAGELYYAEQQLEPNGMLEDVTFNLPDTTKTLQLKGEIPEGTITITTEGKVAIAVYNNRYCVTKGLEDKDVKVTEDVANCKIVIPGSLSSLVTTSTEVTGIPACVTNKTECAPGTPVAIQVNESEVYNFYVLNEIDNEITLIMDRNIGNIIEWVNESDYKANQNCDKNACTDQGPITALNYLNSETSNWTNIPAIENYAYDNNLNGNAKAVGYQKLVITNGNGELINQDGSIKTILTGTSRARLLTEEEAGELRTANNNTFPTWLYTNLYIYELQSPPHGYWLLTAHSSSYYEGRSVYYSGGYYQKMVYNRFDNGIRPVITLTK